ncbi:FAD-dependent oxidoreductase [Amycolatopsis sp.]|jgi:2-polyprenyl-6-methoxyphenol hydroxylase-like FAD-dependent oxidoreductase|uniref:FAD-dependent oxidoreductase n=1 Tax=Amycolatopsis sp. TaxID=37632 RepID=UPI002E04C2E6|nr:FAD-dependent oxidoreductase [Amycolatopsis sp.]
MNEHTTCVIAGGGPAGMVLGLLLARAGVEVTVLEKHNDFLRDFRGDTVHPTTLQLLDELGLGEKFAALPQSRITSIGFPREDNKLLVLGDLGRLKVTHPYIAMVPQWDLLDLLATAAKDEPTFTLRMNTEVTDLLREDGRVAGVAYRTADGTEGELRADLTVACDGRWSIARRLANLTPKEYDVPFDAWWFRLPREEGDPSSITPQMRDKRFAIALPRRGFFQIAYLSAKGDDAELRAAGVEKFREGIAALYPWLGDRVGKLASMDDVKHLDVRLNRLHRWHADGLLCIGDAAHAMSPIGGVGINLAVQDAVATAHLLAGRLRRGRPTEKDLAKVRTRRLLPTVLVQGIQRLLHRAVLGPVMRGERNGPPPVMIKLLGRFPALSAVPAYVIGVGLRPEHAPEFARRQSV